MVQNNVVQDTDYPRVRRWFPLLGDEINARLSPKPRNVTNRPDTDDSLSAGFTGWTKSVGYGYGYGLIKKSGPRVRRFGIENVVELD